MSVNVEWDNPEKTIMRRTYWGRLLLDDLYISNDRKRELAREIDHTFDMISDFREVEGTPPPNVFSFSQQDKTQLANEGLNVVVTNSKGGGLFAKVALDIVRKLRPDIIDRIHLVHSIEDAYALIEREKQAEQRPPVSPAD